MEIFRWLINWRFFDSQGWPSNNVYTLRLWCIHDNHSIISVFLFIRDWTSESWDVSNYTCTPVSDWPSSSSFIYLLKCLQISRENFVLIIYWDHRFCFCSSKFVVSIVALQISGKFRKTLQLRVASLWTLEG